MLHCCRAHLARLLAVLAWFSRSNCRFAFPFLRWPVGPVLMLDQSFWAISIKSNGQAISYHVENHQIPYEIQIIYLLCLIDADKYFRFERRLEINLDDSSIDLYSAMKSASFAIDSQYQSIKNKIMMQRDIC
jgi:hypothetical protein